MWPQRAKHCPLCGTTLQRVEVEAVPRSRCGSCGFVLYLNPASAAAGVVLDGRDRVLLVRRSIEPFRGYWALPAGYQEIDEPPEATAVREVREEAGIEVRVVRLLDLLFVPDDPRKPANVAVYLCAAEGGVLRAGTDASAADWFPLDDLPADIGFDNNRRILSRLASGGRYSGPDAAPAP